MPNPTTTRALDVTQKITLMALGGLLLGALTLFGQGALPGSWNHFANSGAVWLLAAFLVGSRRSSFAWAYVGGAVTLLGALIGYTLGAGAVGLSYPLAAVAFWGSVALGGGPLAGAAGRAWRTDVARLHVMGLAFIGAVFAAEGWYVLTYIQDALAGWVSVGLGVVLVLALARSGRERLYTLVLMVPLTGLGMLVYVFISQAI